MDICLEEMTDELYHRFYRGFQYDPDTFMDMRAFSSFHYDAAWVERYIARQREKKRLVYAIMLKGEPVGEIMLKDIDHEKGECTLSIHLQNDSVKNRGIGTRAKQMLLARAAGELGMRAIYADAVRKNLRSQHVLEKVGFRLGSVSKFLERHIRRLFRHFCTPNP